MVFIETDDNHFVNVQDIAHFRRYKDAASFITLAKHETYVSRKNTHELFVSHLPAIGHEVLCAYGDRTGYLAFDVIAWGVTLYGDIAPIAIENVINEDYAIRRKGETSVTVPNVGTYATTDEWLAMLGPAPDSE